LKNRAQKHATVGTITAIIDPYTHVHSSAVDQSNPSPLCAGGQGFYKVQTPPFFTYLSPLSSIHLSGSSLTAHLALFGFCSALVVRLECFYLGGAPQPVPIVSNFGTNITCNWFQFFEIEVENWDFHSCAPNLKRFSFH
jgi:hypothetical protein